MDRRREADRRARYRAVASSSTFLSAGRRLRDRRRSTRKGIHATLRILKLSCGVTSTVSGKIVDCSNEGVRLELCFVGHQQPAGIGDQLLIEFREETLPLLSVIVEVIWVQPLGVKVIAGCEFQSALVLKQLAILQRLCEPRLPVDNPKITGLAELFHHSI